MNRLKRIITTYEVLAASGARGLSLEAIRTRLQERGFAVDRRQLYRDLRDMKDELDIPVETSDDVTPDQIAEGARVTYFINRLGALHKRLVTSGKAIAAFESVGGRVWGRPLEEGFVTLHCDRNVRPRELFASYGERFPRSRMLYLGEHQFAQFSLEVPRELAFDLHVRIGRVTRESQVPPAPLDDDVVCVGFSGVSQMSRLFGPHGGHAGFVFRSHEAEVDLHDLAEANDDGDSRGRLLVRRPRLVEVSTDATPPSTGFEEAKRRTVTTSTEVSAAGLSLWLHIPS